ncbi:MAG: ATP-binding protein [Chloroflexota bacterium]
MVNRESILTDLLTVENENLDLRRRGFILNVILCVSTAFVLMGLILGGDMELRIWGLTNPYFTSSQTLALLLISYGVIYFINRSSRVRFASITYIFILTSIIFMLDTPEAAVWGQNMIYLVLPIVLAGLILKPAASFYVAGFIGGISLAFSLLNNQFPNLIGATIYMALALASWLTTRHLEQAMRNLRHTNIDLDQKVYDRTLELQLSNARLQSEIGERKLTQLALQEEQLLLERRVQARTAEISQANVELVRLSKVKDEFLANMSHELRTPLNAIIGYSENMLEEAEYEQDLDSYYKEDIQRIQRAGTHLLRLINDILDLSKLEANKMMLNIQAFNIKHLIDRVVDATQPLIDRHSNELIVDNEIPEMLMFSDEQKLTQILLNLTSNAAKFTQAGEIVLTVSRKDQDHVLFEVTDSGVGIPENALSTIFESFRQAENSKSRSFEGTGLGLTISKRFVRMMGGTLEVESEVGVGSTFRAILPLTIDTDDQDIEATIRSNLLGLIS